jgi:hypothetical protein
MDAEEDVKPPAGTTGRPDVDRAAGYTTGQVRECISFFCDRVKSFWTISVTLVILRLLVVEFKIIQYQARFSGIWVTALYPVPVIESSKALVHKALLSYCRASERFHEHRQANELFLIPLNHYHLG